MPRPKKKRTIFHRPLSDEFLPGGEALGEVVIPLEELEALRLTDLEHLDQSECARRMNVARTTAQNMINAAHEKIADALVNSKRIVIAGGDYEYVDDAVYGCCRHVIRTVERIGGLPGMDKREKEKKSMILAVSYDPQNEEIFQHFGRTEYFKVYTVDTDREEITDRKVVSTGGEGHGALAGVLKEIGADALICGGIGGGAQTALAEAGIRLFGGVTGKCDDAAKAFVAGNLTYQEDVMCHHHGEHHHEGGCGHHHGEHHHEGGCGHHHGE